LTQNIQIPKELELLKQLTGEWTVGIALKISEDKIVSGCGEMSAVEISDLGINSEINTHIEGYDDFFENDLWTFDRASGKMHLFSMTSEGEAHDHFGGWVDSNILELNWRGTFEDQELEERIRVRWVDKDQIELRETNLELGKEKFIIDYVFKRKEPNQAT
jgi:hypothetical protein